MIVLSVTSSHGQLPTKNNIDFHISIKKIASPPSSDAVLISKIEHSCNDLNIFTVNKFAQYVPVIVINVLDKEKTYESCSQCLKSKIEINTAHFCGVVLVIHTLIGI